MVLNQVNPQRFPFFPLVAFFVTASTFLTRKLADFKSGKKLYGSNNPHSWYK